MADNCRAQFYKIECKDSNVLECYIGSTNDFRLKEQQHKTFCNNKNSEIYNSKLNVFIRANGGWDNFRVVLIEEYFCGDKKEAKKRQRYWFDTFNPTLNTNHPRRLPEKKLSIYFV